MVKGVQLVYALIGLVVAFIYQFAGLSATYWWFIGIIVFSVLLGLIGKSNMPRASAETANLWKLAYAYAILITAVVSFGGLIISGYITPDPAHVVAYWFVVFGAAMFATGHAEKKSVPIVIGIIWVFSALFLAAYSSGFHYGYAGLVFGLPFIIDSFLGKNKR